jgi:uncharacterized membrane protein YtjA (UPF0391 family)
VLADAILGAPIGIAAGRFYSACKPRPSLQPCTGKRVSKGSIMLKWALIFAVVSLIAGVLGFTGIAAGAAGIAKTLFFVFLVIFLVLLVLAMLGASAIKK